MSFEHELAARAPILETKPAWVRAIAKLDETLARVERIGAAGFCAIVFVLITCAVIVRYLRIPIFWIDEVAVFAMVWMAFLSAAHAVFSNEHIAVSFAADYLPNPLSAVAAIIVNATMVGLGLVFCALAWLWFDPIVFAAAGFDAGAFGEATLNFIYSEPTASFQAPKALFWAIMPIFSLLFLFHASVRLLLARPSGVAGELDEETS